MTMQSEQNTVLVPREEWEAFFEQFTEFNEETSVRVELVGSPDAGTQILAEDRPLLAISVDREAGPEQIVIECGDTVGESPAAFRHLVRNPTAVRVRKTEPSGWDAIQIETAGEGSIVLTVNPHPGRGQLDLENVGRSELHIP